MHPKSLFLLVLLFPSLPALAQEGEDTKIKAAVEGNYQQYVAAENKKDSAAVTSLFDDNAVLLPNAEEAAIGKAAISEFYKKQMADPQFVPFTLNSDWNSFYVAGDVAIATSVFEGDAIRNNKQIHFRGKNFLVWKKETDGSWKIFRYMYDEIPLKK